jgi:hypothetical protein
LERAAKDFSLSSEERAGVRTVVSIHFVFDARPHLNPLPQERK